MDVVDQGGELVSRFLRHVPAAHSHSGGGWWLGRCFRHFGRGRGAGACEAGHRHPGRAHDFSFREQVIVRAELSRGGTGVHCARLFGGRDLRLGHRIVELGQHLAAAKTAQLTALNVSHGRQNRGPERRGKVVSLAIRWIWAIVWRPAGLVGAGWPLRM
jgi:hypothetical protein